MRKPKAPKTATLTCWIARRGGYMNDWGMMSRSVAPVYRKKDGFEWVAPKPELMSKDHVLWPLIEMLPPGTAVEVSMTVTPIGEIVVGK